MKTILVLFQLLSVTGFAFSQNLLDSSFSVYRHGRSYNSGTKTWETFALCGQYITADTTGFFSMQTGCERNVWIALGHYTFTDRKFEIRPFDYTLEAAFLSVRKIPKTGPTQKVQFFTADFQPIKGYDSSWVIRLVKKRKSVIIDNTGEQIITLRRGSYDRMELLQMTKIFGAPVVLFLDKRFDYKVAINLPHAAVERFIIGGTSVGGTGIVKDSLFFLNDDPDGFKFVSNEKQKRL